MIGEIGNFKMKKLLLILLFLPFIGFGQSQQKGLNIPNAFTPNCDGYNDCWIITGENVDNIKSLEIYNRSGQQVFKADGNIPWDGWTSNGEKVSGNYWTKEFKK